MFSLMGNCCSRIRKRRQPKRPVTLAILGLDSAGKTTTTKVFLGDTLDTAPTIGFNKEEFEYGRFSIVLYDLGGGQRIRDIWKDYLNEIYGVIYVVDSSARERITEVKDNLWNLISHDMVKKKPLLILANKEDIKGHMDEVDLMEKLKIEKLVNTYASPCKMVTCSAIKGTGKKMDPNLKEGMGWLCSILDQLYDTIKERVDRDTEVVEQRRQKEKEERRERVRKQREERERLEEEQNKKLGIKKEEDDDDDDDIVMDGANPFRPLDAAEIQRKEEKFKLSKEKEKEKKKRLKELEAQENVNHGFTADTNVNTNNGNNDDEDDFVVPRSSRSLGSFGLFNGGLSQRKLGDDGADSDSNMPRSGRQLLPPLQSPLGTKFMDGNVNSNKDKKKKKKQKQKNNVENDLYEHPYENRLSEQEKEDYGQSTMTVSKIEVFSNEEDSENSDNNLAGKHKYMKDMDTKPNDTKKKKMKGNFMSDEDGFDTLRLSQHFDDNDDDTQSARSVTPTQANMHLQKDKKGGKSETPVKKLKKKNKHLRKNKLAPSDDEFELTDVSQSPKKDLPWARSPSPKMLDTIKDDRVNDNRWGFAEDLAPMAGSPSQVRSRPNFESEDDLVL